MNQDKSLRTKAAWVIVFAVLLILGGGLLPATAQAQSYNIMPLGDSITDGAAGSTDDTGYRRSLYLQLTGAGYSVDFVGGQTSGIPLDFDRDHEGHGGWRADQIRDNIYNWLVSNPADIVLLHIGTNDVSGGNEDVAEVEAILNNIDQYEADYTASVKVLLARIILRTDSRNPQTIALNDAVETMALLRIAGGDDIVMVDQENALTYPGDMDDSVHPNDTGYGKMADEWFAVLDPILTASGTVSVSNVALTASSPGNLTTDDLTCSYTLEGAATTAATAWYRNGSPEMAFYLPMEGGEPSALLDYSGNSIVVSKMDDPTWNSSAGHDGFGAYEFDGGDGLNGGENFPINSSYTKSAWVYRTGSGDNGGNNIISCDENVGGHAFWAPDSKSNHLSAGHTGPAWSGVEDDEPLALNTWYFVAVTYDDVDDLMILYKDGAEVDRATVADDVTDPSIFIGTFGAGGYRWMGTIDDPRVHSHALSPEQISALYSTGRDVCLAEETTVGDQWRTQVTPFSATESGITVASDIITIQSGTGPQIQNLNIASESGNDLPTDDLICSFDLAGTATTAATAWTKNGTPLMTLYMPCEGGQTNALLDYSGNGYSGIMGAGVTWSATGGHDGNGAFDFDGTDDAEIDMGIIMPTGAYTKCAWVKRQGGEHNNIISGDTSHAFWAPSGEGFRLAAGHNNGWDNRVIDTGDPLAVDTWYFVAVTFDPAVGSGEMILYKNGAIVDSATGVPTQADDGRRVWVGTFNSDSPYTGTIDDPRLYPYALSSEQILEIYTSGINRIDFNETNGGDQWQAQVTAFSATEAGSTVPSNTVTIQTDASVTNVTLSSTSGNDLTTDDLTCNYSLAGAAITAGTAWYRDSTPEMSAYLPMEGGPTSALLDYSGSNNHGSLGSDPSWVPTGGHDTYGYFDFDGNDYISLGNPMPNAGAYTKAVWVYWTPGGYMNNILSGDSGHAFWVTSYPEGNDLSPVEDYYLSAGHSDPWRDVKDTSSFPPNQWVHVTVTYDPAVDGGTMILYRAGAEVDRTTGLAPNSDTQAFLGAFRTSGPYLLGNLDDARIYLHALSAEQVASLHTTGRDVIVSQETDSGEDWQAYVTPFSATEAGTAVPSSPLTIQGTPTGPALENLALTSTSGNDLSTDDLTCGFDLAGTATTATTAWTKDGSPILTLYYPFEGGSSNALIDYSGSGNDGAAGGDPAWNATAGHDNHGCIQLDGNDFIDAGNCKPTGAYTKSAWVYWIDDVTTTDNIISGQSDHAFWISDFSGERLTAGHHGNWDDVADPELFVAGVWTFVAVTYDPDVAGGTLTLYKHGLPVDSTTGISASTDTRAYVGAYNGAHQLQGNIDDARIYDSALSADQVYALFTGGDTIVAAETAIGEAWQAQVTPFSASEAGSTTGSNTLTIVDLPFAPTIISTAVTSAMIDRLYSYDVEASGQPLPQYELTGSPPSGMTIDSASGLIEWMPTTGQEGPHSISVRAWNSEGEDTQNYDIDVSGSACPADMTHYWKLEETTGPPYADSYGTNDGSCSNCPETATGIVGEALFFDGQDDEVAVPDDGSWNWGPEDSFSIEYWMMTSASTVGNRVIVARDDGASDLHIWVGCDDNGTVRFQCKDTNYNGPYIGGTGMVLNDGLWHHVVAVRDESIDENSIYVDGVKTHFQSHDYTAGFGGSAPLTIGYIELGGNYRYEGIVDEVATYDRALTADEILYHYNSRTGRDYCTSYLSAPTITSTPLADGVVGELYSYDVEATGDPAPNFALLTMPTGMTIDPVTGLIQWTPAGDQTGPNAVEVEASNTEGTDTQSFSVDVVLPPTCPVDLIAYWKLDESSGTDYTDYFGNHDGYTAIPPTPIAGQVSGAQEFDGAGSTGTNEISVPAHSDFDWGAGDSFSIEFWMNLDAIPTENDVIVGRDHGGGGNSLHWWTGVQANTGLPTWNQAATSGDAAAVTGVTNIADGSWHHLAFVRIAGDGNYIYLDGVQDGYTSKENYNAGFDSPTAEINIGWLWIDKKYTYDGIVDEVAVYNRALDPNEIMYHYNQGVAGYGYCTDSPTPPAVLADLSAAQVLTGSPPGSTASTTAIHLTWTAPSEPNAATVEIYRKGFGYSPEYDDDGGAEPDPPTAPGTEGWEHVASLSAADVEYYDAPPLRDFWYYVGYVTDWYTVTSGVSDMTTGTLDYFLGDMSDGGDPPGEGNNEIGTEDLSLLGSCYGTDGLDPLYNNVADVGPTYDMSVHDCPQTDNLINFEDLIVCAINYGIGGGPTAAPALKRDPPLPADRNILSLQVPSLPDVGQTFEVELDMSGDGQVQGLSLLLEWNADVVVPLAAQPGQLLQDQGGPSSVLCPQPGVVDVALLGARDRGISGEGVLATASFRVLAAGDPQLALSEVSARNAANETVAWEIQVPTDVPGQGPIPKLTTLHANAPNPFNPRTTIAFDLAEAGRATVNIYGVDGRLVKSLVDGRFPAGRYTRVWDGTDRLGKSVASGVYLVRLKAADKTQLRRMLLLR